MLQTSFGKEIIAYLYAGIATTVFTMRSSQSQPCYHIRGVESVLQSCWHHTQVTHPNSDIRLPTFTPICADD
jgi:hypothetical protein